jgi:periplasmic mercuric ion binding protein
MKAKKIITGLFVMVFIFGSLSAMSQSKSKFQKIDIKSSVQCGMCKDRVETAFAFEKGVKKSVVNMATKTVTVTYDPNKTSPEKLRAVIAKVGYDADDVLADPVAYEALPGCCKKPAGNNGQIMIKTN